MVIGYTTNLNLIIEKNRCGTCVPDTVLVKKMGSCDLTPVLDFSVIDCVGLYFLDFNVPADFIGHSGQLFVLCEENVIFSSTFYIKDKCDE